MTMNAKEAREYLNDMFDDIEAGEFEDIYGRMVTVYEFNNCLTDKMVKQYVKKHNDLFEDLWAEGEEHFVDARNDMTIDFLLHHNLIAR